MAAARGPVIVAAQRLSLLFNCLVALSALFLVSRGAIRELMLHYMPKFIAVGDTKTGAGSYEGSKEMVGPRQTFTARKLQQYDQYIASPPPPDDDDDDEGGDSDGCSRDDIVISQGPTEPLPDGVPAFTVQISNRCDSGCSISNIHVSCGWFSSTRIVNPMLFRRLYYDDCLVNEGNPMAYGEILSFVYSNSFSYPLSVASVSCPADGLLG